MKALNLIFAVILLMAIGCKPSTKELKAIAAQQEKQWKIDSTKHANHEDSLVNAWLDDGIKLSPEDSKPYIAIVDKYFKLAVKPNKHSWQDLGGGLGIDSVAMDGKIYSFMISPLPDAKHPNNRPWFEFNSTYLPTADHPNGAYPMMDLEFYYDDYKKEGVIRLQKFTARGQYGKRRPLIKDKKIADAQLSEMISILEKRLKSNSPVKQTFN